MKLRDAFASTVSAIALLGNVAMITPAFAQDSPAPSSPPTTETVPAKGTLIESWSVAIDPHLPVEAIGGLGAAYLLLCLYAHRRRLEGAAYRAGVGGVIALALLNPGLQHENRETLPTEVVVVVDQSSSQSLEKRTQETQKIQADLTKELAGLGSINIRIVDVGAPKSGAPVDGTNIFTALDDAMSDIPRDRIGAVFMLTDGLVHDIPETPKPIAKGVPLHALISGHEGEKDRRIVIDQAPRFGLLNQQQIIKFRVLDDGVAGYGQKVRVSINNEGKSIGTQYVTPGEIVEMKVDLPHTGTNMIEFKVDPLAGELTDVNNRIVASIEGIRESLNVLVVSGAPDAGTRTVRDLFKSDADSTLIHFSILRNAGNVDDVSSDELSIIPFPMDELFINKLSKFDLVVFDSFANEGIVLPEYLENIAKYVRDGGALMVINGKDYGSEESLYLSPLGPILPISPTGQVTEDLYKPKIGEAGLRHPVTRGLNGGDDKAPQWGSWTRFIGGERVSGDVLMVGPNQKPLLALDHKDKGRVAMLMSDNSWLWAKGYDGGGPYVDLMRRISHWLMKSPALEEEALRMRRQDNNIVIEEQTMADKPVSVILRAPSGAATTLVPQAASPGLWQITVPASEMGLYSVEQSGKHPMKSFINIGPVNPREFAGTISTTDLLKQAVEISGGKIGRMVDDSGQAVLPKLTAKKNGQEMSGDDWLGIRMTDASILKGVDRTPLFPLWVLALLAMGMLAKAVAKEGETSFSWKKKQPRNDDPGMKP